MNTEVKTHSAAVGWIGIIAVVAFCIMWLACYRADSSWTWCVDTLSEFGVSSTAAANYFAYGLVISGALLAVFGVGKVQCSQGKIGYNVGGALLAISGFALVLVGLLTKDVSNGDYHTFFAWMLATLFLVAVIVIVIQEYLDGHVLSVGIGMVMLFAIVSFAALFSFEKFETSAILLALGWVVLNSVMMIINGIKEGKSQ